MGPDKWRSFTDPPFLGEAPAPSTIEEAIRGALTQIPGTAERIMAQQAAARQAAEVAKQQGRIELAKVQAEAKRSEAEARTAALAIAAGQQPPILGGGKLPTWVTPVAIGAAAIFLLSGLFRRGRRA